MGAREACVGRIFIPRSAVSSARESIDSDGFFGDVVARSGGAGASDGLERLDNPNGSFALAFDDDEWVCDATLDADGGGSKPKPSANAFGCRRDGGAEDVFKDANGSAFA